MSDLELYCQQCGEPWPYDELHELGSYGLDFLGGKGCPCCNMGDTAPSTRPVRAEMMQIAREQFGDDLKTIALELHDMKEKELLDGVF